MVTLVDNDSLVRDDIYLYTERSSRMIVEVQLFSDYCLVRPVSPQFYNYIKKMSHTDLVKDYDEYAGERETVLNYLRGIAQEVVTSDD